MNIVKLEKEQQTQVINRAVQILRQRVIGGVKRIREVDEEFMALSKNDTQRKFPKVHPRDMPEERKRKAELWPESLEVTSVSRALQEAVAELISRERPHIEKPILSEGNILSLGWKVMDILNSPTTRKTKLPYRLAEAIQLKIEQNEHSISLLESQIHGFLRHYFEAEEDHRGKIFQDMQWMLQESYWLYKNNKDLDDAYDLSVLSEKRDEDEDDEDEDEVPWGEVGSTALKDFSWESDSILTFEENIRLSSAEYHLKGFLPREIQDYEELFENSFFWWGEGDEWQRETLNIRNIPERYREMLEKMLYRKLLIYSYAEQTLKKEEKTATQPKQNRAGCGKIRKYLPELEEEIVTLFAKIEKLQKADATIEILSDPEGIKRSLEESLDYLQEQYLMVLLFYTKAPDERPHITQKILWFETEILKKYTDLQHHCTTNWLESDHLGIVDSTEPAEAWDETIMTVDEYLEDPNYFEHFPTVLTAEKSDSERILLMLCDICTNPALSYYITESAKIQFFCEEPDGSETPQSEKMKMVEEVLNIFLKRKMSTYFHATLYLKTHTNPEISYHVEILEREIDAMKKSIMMLTNRIDWLEEPDDIREDLENEMHHLSQRRFHLFQAFLNAQDGISRQIIGSKILQLCLALEKRRDTLFDADEEINMPDTHIEVAGLSYVDSRLMRYIFTDIREWEGELFAKNMPFPMHPWKSGRENKLGMEKAKISQLSERKMMIYFFAMKRMDEIDMELCMWTNDDDEKLVTEREELELHTAPLVGEIMPLLQILQTMNESPIPRQETQKKLYYQDLYNEAMKVLWSLDGAIANTEGEHVRMVRDYWEKIQRQVLRFSDRIQIEESKWNLHKIPALQEEFDTEMVQIIHDIEQYLGKILEKHWHKGREQEVLMREIHRIRERLFGKPQTH